MREFTVPGAAGRRGAVMALTMAALVAASMSLRAATDQSQKTFATPQEAIEATIQASENNDTAALRQIFGTFSKEIVESGDPAQDKQDRAEFARLARTKLHV